MGWLLWIGFGLFITAGLGHLEALIVWAPMAAFGVFCMTVPRSRRPRKPITPWTREQYLDHLRAKQAAGQGRIANGSGSAT